MTQPSGDKSYLADVLDQARATRDRVVADFGGFDEPALNWKPAPGRWSIAQCLQHLIVSTREYDDIFEAIAEGSHRPTFAAKIPLLPRLWGPLARWSVSPQTRVKVPTTQALEPSASDISGAIVDEFRVMVDHHIARIHELDHVDHRNVIVASPFAGFVCYSLEDAVRISVLHLERHRLQAERVTEAPGFPDSPPA